MPEDLKDAHLQDFAQALEEIFIHELLTNIRERFDADGLIETLAERHDE